ncbi:TIGR03943 family putative permease subunit [Pilimelia columellifera]|uniref:TIGR03943 family protein n=1 Tax=Pilimelia columellifera subsp. columellifera TaxID=706583 RepID=A0ABN3NP06_9ACTN
MNKRAQAVVMLLLGGALIRATLSDLHLRYVKESLGPFLIASGVLLVIAGAMTLLYELRPGHGAEAVPECAGDGDDDHGHHEPRVGWLLILPVLGLLLVAPPALGAYSASQTGSILNAANQPSDFPPLPQGDPVEIGLADYASRSVFDKGRTLAGRQIRMVGFLSANPDGTQYLTRMVLSCCAADGRPIKLGMAGDPPAGQPDNGWVQVVGTYTDKVAEDPVNQAQIPFVQVVSWEPIAPPKQPYE